MTCFPLYGNIAPAPLASAVCSQSRPPPEQDITMTIRIFPRPPILAATLILPLLIPTLIHTTTESLALQPAPSRRRLFRIGLRATTTTTGDDDDDDDDDGRRRRRRRRQGEGGEGGVRSPRSDRSHRHAQRGVQVRRHYQIRRRCHDPGRRGHRAVGDEEQGVSVRGSDEEGRGGHDARGRRWVYERILVYIYIYLLHDMSCLVCAGRQSSPLLPFSIYLRFNQTW